MPSGKEYSMRFILESQLGSSFKGSFTQAQKQLQQMQSQIQALSKEQANITAYQKQQDAVEKTSRKLADLQKEYDNIQREISETETYSSSLENKLIEKQRAIDNTSVSLTKQTEKLEHYETVLESSGIDTKNLGSESDRLTAELEELRQEQEKVNAEAEDYGNIGVSSITAVGDALLAAGIAKGLKEIYDAYGDCVQLAAEFQSTMSTVEALSGASTEDMAQLSALAKELGATTKFTASESAQAMTYMAMAGWDAEQMMSGMDGVMQLAAASGEDLAMVSDIVTDNLTAFGLAASDTARFSDVLAAAATNSNTSVSVMGETFKNSAALAGALGYSVEDVAVAVGLMANAGIKGSNAGTALKNVFNGLLEGVTLTSDAFGEVEYSAINADGTMKSFGETLDDLRYYFNQMTGAEQLQNASAIAGQRAMSGFVSILNASEGDIQKLTDSINNSAGAAQRMADIKMNNLTGQLTLLNSAADAVKTTVGEAYQNEFQALAKVGTDILTEVNEFLTAHPQLMRFFIALVAEVGALVAIYTTYKAIKSGMNVVHQISLALTAKETAATVANTAAVTAEAAATGAATTAQVGLNAAMAANPIGLVIAGVSTLAIGLATLVASMGSAEDETEQLTYASREQYEELQNLNAEYQQTCEEFGETSWQAQELKSQIDELTTAYDSNAQTLADFYSKIDEDISAYDEMVDGHKSAIEEIENEDNSVLSLVSRLDALTSSTDTAKNAQEEIYAIIKLLNEQVPELALEYDSLTNSLSTSTEAIIANAEARAKQKRYEANNAALEENLMMRGQLEADLKAAEEEQKAAQAVVDQWTETWDSYTDAARKSGARNAATGSTYDKMAKESKAASDSLSAANEKLDELRTRYEENETEIERLTGEIRDYNLALTETNDVAEELSDEGLANLNRALQLVQSGDLDVDTAARMFGVDPERLQSSSDALAAYKENLDSAITAVENGWLTADEAAETCGVTIEEMEVAAKIDETADSLAALVEHYDEVYQAAYESINGQYDLWDEAAVVIPKSIGDINTALETQTSYWSDYNTDLENLLGRVDDIDGLREIIASFADGSEDSVNAIAGMAAASDDELREMVKNWQEVQKYQQEATDSVAELATGFSEQYGEMKDELETAVEDLNLSDEAAEAAELTVEAYVEAIRGGTDAAVEEAQRLSALVAMALYDAPGVTAPKKTGGSSSMPRGLRNANDLDRVTMLSAYAVGTDSAAPGAALVGENGPEIVMFEGGEKVYTAEETRQLLQESKELRELNIEKDADNLKFINAYAIGSDNAEPGAAIVGERGPELVIFEGGEKVFTAEETRELIRENSEMRELGAENDIENLKIISAYAVGTDNASPGAALVGENGPELISFGGKQGDISNVEISDMLIQYFNEAAAMQAMAAENAEAVQVVTISPTLEALSADSELPAYGYGGDQNIEISISPSFTVEGGNVDDIEERLNEFSERLRDEIIDALEEAGIDAKRSAYR